MRSLASGVAAGLTAGVLLAPGVVPAGPSSDLVKQIENEIEKVFAQDKLAGSNLEGNLSGEKLVKVNLNNTKLQGATVKKVNSKSANLKKANLGPVKKLRPSPIGNSELNPRCAPSRQGANLTGANRSYANLTNADLTKADLRDVSLREGATLEGANLTDASLRRTGVWRV